MIRSQSLKALHQLPREIARRAQRRMRALGDDHDLIAHTAVPDPLAEQALLYAAAIDPGGVEGVAAVLEEVVEHDGGVREGGLVVATHYQTRGLLVDSRDRAIFHTPAGRRRKRAAGDG